MEKDISELLQQIRQVENEHNQLVDEYFQISMYNILMSNELKFSFFRRQC